MSALARVGVCAARLVQSACRQSNKRIAAWQPVVPLTPANAVASAPQLVFVRGHKTRTSIKKRFRVRPNGTILRARCNKRHLNLHKSRARVNKLGKPQFMQPAACLHAHCTSRNLPCYAGKIGVVATKGIRKRYMELLGIRNRS
jgi:ribosomal protein L35